MADSLATDGIVHSGCSYFAPLNGRKFSAMIRGWFDGGCRNGVMGAGCVIEAAFVVSSKGEPEWSTVATYGVRLGREGCSDLAELSACGFLICGIADLLCCNDIRFDPFCYVVPRSDAALMCRKAIDSLLTSYGCTATRPMRAG